MNGMSEPFVRCIGMAERNMVFRRINAMAYNEFTLPGLKRLFGLQIDERKDLFAHAPPAPVSAWLRETLDYQLPLALEISTEKARSELIIMPVLVAMRRQLDDQISLFSGIEFNVDAESG